MSLPVTDHDLSWWTQAETRLKAENSNIAICLTVGSKFGLSWVRCVFDKIPKYIFWDSISDFNPLLCMCV